MAKKAYIKRYVLLLDFLRSRPYARFEDIQEYLENSLLQQRLIDDRFEMGFSKRTLQRDIKEIRDIFGINIEYSLSRKGYYLDESSENESSFINLINATEVLRIYQENRLIKQYIELQPLESKGMHYLFTALEAIKNKEKITIDYRKHNEEWKQYILNPLFIKEYKRRLFLVAMHEEKLKVFGFDRIQAWKNMKTKHDSVLKDEMKNLFKNSMGISVHEKEPLEEVLFKAMPIKAKYMKAFPLHGSQEIIEDNESGTTFRIACYLTQELLMEMLSHGSEIKILGSNRFLEVYKKNVLEMVKNLEN